MKFLGHNNPFMCEKFKSNIILKNRRKSRKKFNLEENNLAGKFQTTCVKNF